MTGRERLLREVGNDGGEEGEGEGVGFGDGKSGGVAARVREIEDGESERSARLDARRRRGVDSRSRLSLESDLLVGDLKLGLSDDVGEVDGQATSEEGGRGGSGGKGRSQVSSCARQTRPNRRRETREEGKV